MKYASTVLAAFLSCLPALIMPRLPHGRQLEHIRENKKQPYRKQDYK
jgi:hypothetical protein